jgi:alpha-mannosidase
MEPGLPEEVSPANDQSTAVFQGRWRLVALITNDGQEPPGHLADSLAEGTWAAISALWHPALLAGTAELPRFESVEYPSSPEADEVRVIAFGAEDRLPSGYRTQAADAGTILLDGDADRNALLKRILGCVDTGATALDTPDPLVLDFLALGTARWWLRDLTIGMGHVDCLDVESLTRETLAGARAWLASDRTAASSRLRAAFELLTQARERFYPVDAYMIDLCLLDPSAPAGALADALEARAPVSFLAPARAIEAQAQRDPERLAKLREAISEGWADVVGGTYGEADEPFRPFESILWQFRRGGETYRKYLDDRNVETLARRRFGLYPQLPQIAKRFGFRFGLHYAFDTGRFPVPLETKKLWESPDGSYLESLMRLPIAADRPLEGLMLPWRMARAMRDDHVATLPLVHWPSPVAGWFLDLRRTAVYSPVLARWVTTSDYFHRTDRPFEMFRPELDQYVTPYLVQAVGRRDPTPVSRRVEITKLRARFNGLSCLAALVSLLGPKARETPAEPAAPGSGAIDAAGLRALEDALESGRLEEARDGLERDEPRTSQALADIVMTGATSDRAGYLVFNPLGVARRVPVLLPDAAADLRTEGPLRAAQFTDEGVWAVADVPAFGYAWVPKETAPESPPPPIGVLGVREQMLRNELLEVEIDAKTGGIRSFCAAGEATARLGQQLVVAGLVGSDGEPIATRMECDRFEVDYGGPALVQAISEGRIVNPGDGITLAKFRQRFRLWTGRPILDVRIALSEIDPRWLEERATDDPWKRFLSCRWAWPDADADLRRLCLHTPELTSAERPETPEAIDLTTRRTRTALLFGGLAHHRRHGTRMLDTLLIAGSETCRQFDLSVALDQEYPFQAVQDQTLSAHVVATEKGPPLTGPSGWLFHLDHKAVAVTSVERVMSTDPNVTSHVLAFHLVETSGRSVRGRLRLVQPPHSARQTDYQNELIAELSTEGDAVLVDLTPFEAARIEVVFG